LKEAKKQKEQEANLESKNIIIKNKTLRDRLKQMKIVELFDEITKFVGH
jgi:hypothetical protein